MEITVTDVHWTAGFLDGDGTFSLTGISPRIGATQAETMPLMKLADLWGGTVHPKKSNLGTKPLQSWALGGHKAVGLMMMLYDLLSPPRQWQIRRVMTQWRDNGALNGQQHYKSVLTDEAALIAMQDVLDGELVTRAARRLGVSYATLITWLKGTRRPDLLQKLQGNASEKVYGDSLPFAQRRVSRLLCDVHYTAGFLEAEGCFSATPNAVSMQGIQVERAPLEKLQQLWGGHIYQRKPHASQRAVSTWHLNGTAAAALMMTLYPLMSPSRQYIMRKSLAGWRARKVQHGATHYGAVASDEDALTAMRHLRDGRSLNVVVTETGISRFVLSQWMRGKNRPYLLRRLEAEGKPNHWAYNGGRRARIFIDDARALDAIRRVKAGEPINSVARSLDVQHVVVLDWVRGKNRPHLLAQLEQEEQLPKEESVWT